MNRTLFLLFLAFSIQLSAQDALTSNKSMTYHDLLEEYKNLDHQFDQAFLIPYGKDDCGETIHLFVISGTSVFQPQRLHELNKCILFINNGIHPGEPDGMDASLIFAKELLYKESNHKLLENVVVCIIPTYNIGGALNRNSYSRANQDGPEEYGFRGNARNLDLNRDFIKTDAANTKTLKQILLQWNPDVFVDTHVSDGADYQYTMTLVSSQHNKMSPPAGKYMHDVFTPALFQSMKSKKDEMSPYVECFTYESSPDSGIIGFLETPRFATGYTSLSNCFSFITETHMLKPFPERVKSTQRFLNSMMSICSEKKDEILTTRKNAEEFDLTMKKYPFNWETDFSKHEELSFKGYESTHIKSKVTSGNRLKYYRDKPYVKTIPFYNEYKANDTIEIPKFFYVPQAWENIVRMLEANGVKSIRMNKDTSGTFTSLSISDFKTTDLPFEGHYLHFNTKTTTQQVQTEIKKGDYMINCNQKAIRIILETLIPSAVDSYFNWGFFDSILQQKEWFSSYVFEDIAEKLLSEDSKLKTDFEKWKAENPKEDEFNQLYYVYSHSKYFEESYRRYPVRLVY